MFNQILTSVAHPRGVESIINIKVDIIQKSGIMKIAADEMTGAIEVKDKIGVIEIHPHTGEMRIMTEGDIILGKKIEKYLG